MIQEFKDFVNKGNVIDLAVAVVIGAAFAPVVGTFVDRVMMPLIGMVVGQPNFDTLGVFACQDIPAEGAAEGLIVSGNLMCSGSVGAVLTVIINFLLVALAVFLVIKAYNSTKAPEPEVEAEPEPDPEDIILLRDIRDSLANR